MSARQIVIRRVIFDGGDVEAVPPLTFDILEREWQGETLYYVVDTNINIYASGTSIDQLGQDLTHEIGRLWLQYRNEKNPPEDIKAFLKRFR